MDWIVLHWIEVLGYAASGIIFATFWMKTITALRLVGIVGNVAFLSYGLSADLGNIALLHGALLPLNAFRLYQAIILKRRLHALAHASFDPHGLLPFMTRTFYPKGSVLFQTGDEATAIYFLLEGYARITELNVDITPGHLVGEIALFTPDKKRTQTVRCVDNCIFMILTEDKVLELYAANPEFGLYLTKMMVQRLLANMEYMIPHNAN